MSDPHKKSTLPLLLLLTCVSLVVNGKPWNGRYFEQYPVTREDSFGNYDGGGDGNLGDFSGPHNPDGDRRPHSLGLLCRGGPWPLPMRELRKLRREYRRRLLLAFCLGRDGIIDLRSGASDHHPHLAMGDVTDVRAGEGLGINLGLGLQVIGRIPGRGGRPILLLAPTVRADSVLRGKRPGAIEDPTTGQGDNLEGQNLDGRAPEETFSTPPTAGDESWRNEQQLPDGGLNAGWAQQPKGEQQGGEQHPPTNADGGNKHEEQQHSDGETQPADGEIQPTDGEIQQPADGEQQPPGEVHQQENEQSKSPGEPGNHQKSASVAAEPDKTTESAAEAQETQSPTEGNGKTGQSTAREASSTKSDPFVSNKSKV